MSRKSRRMGIIVGSLVGLIVVLVGIAYAGTKVDARPFDSPETESRDLGTRPLPDDVPEPVARYARAVFGDAMPVIESALIIGRAEATFSGVTVPVRFKMVHRAGQDYYHYMQVTWFGFPVLTVNEQYLDGVGTMELPNDLIKDDPKINLAANLGLWAESIWLPSIFFTDERVTWEAIDDHTARLIVPDAAPEETFTVNFDPQTGLIADLVTQRWQEPGSETRSRWTNRVLGWKTINGMQIPVDAETQWNDDTPWAVWHIEDILYNIDVSARFEQFGGEVAYP